MSKFIFVFGVIIAPLMMVNTACGQVAKAPSETPAPLQEKGKTLSYNFDKTAAGSLPDKFHEGLTGKGPQVKWEVKADPTAPSLPNVFA